MRSDSYSKLVVWAKRRTLVISLQCFAEKVISFSGMEYGNVSLTFAAFLLQSLGHQLGLTAPFDPSRWPVLFNRPYSLTSLNDLWSRRWYASSSVLRHWFMFLRHALFFRQFIALGLKPGRALFRWTGRKPSLACGLLCAFLVSGLMHEWVSYHHVE